MSFRQPIIYLLHTVLLACAAGAACGQGLTRKPVRILAPEAGGGADLVARVVAQGLTASGQQAVVDNRGGSAIIPAEIVLNAPPDGLTLLFSANAHWLLPLFQENVPYDPIRDYAPITLTTTSPGVIAVHPSMPVKSVNELVALAKARPGDINCASGTKGATTWLSAELFKAMTGIQFTEIPYKGAGPALNATIAGQVQMIIITASTVMPHVKSGRLRGLAVASATPSALAPGLPTAAAAGLPGYETGTMHAMFAPAKTPEAIVARLNQAVVAYLNAPDTRSRLFNAGMDVVAGSPAEGLLTVQTEITRIRRMIAGAGTAPR